MNERLHDAGECSGCDWERQPQAFRWFPELGRPLEPGRHGPVDSSATRDSAAPRGRRG